MMHVLHELLGILCDVAWFIAAIVFIIFCRDASEMMKKLDDDDDGEAWKHADD